MLHPEVVLTEISVAGATGVTRSAIVTEITITLLPVALLLTAALLLPTAAIVITTKAINTCNSLIYYNKSNDINCMP